MTQIASQPEFDFTTPSPINVERLSGQNRRLYDHLISGKRINCLSPEMSTLRIGYLNSRISDLKNKYKVDIKCEYKQIPDGFGEVITVKEYWIE